MTITKYTFFSPNGNDFPITSNADGKLYMMLTGMNYEDLRLKNWENPIDTALNRVYTKTSIIIGGRYFELTDHSIVLNPSVTNYIHAVIDLANTVDPVTIVVEKTNKTNSIDINNTSGILKVCFDIVVTSATSIVSSKTPKQVSVLESVVATNVFQSVKKASSTVNGTTGLINYIRIGNVVQVNIRSIPNMSKNVSYNNIIPVGFRPIGGETISLTHASNRLSFREDGSVFPDNNDLTSNDGYYTFMYLTTNPFPDS